MDRCLRNAISLVTPGGYLSTVLQLPSTEEADVSPSPFPAIQALGEHFHLVNPSQLRARLATDGFALVCETRRGLPAGKALWLGVFQRQERPGS